MSIWTLFSLSFYFVLAVLKIWIQNCRTLSKVCQLNKFLKSMYFCGSYSCYLLSQICYMIVAHFILLWYKCHSPETNEVSCLRSARNSTDLDSCAHIKPEVWWKSWVRKLPWSWEREIELLIWKNLVMRALPQDTWSCQG